jgi:hypothetical protein
MNKDFVKEKTMNTLISILLMILNNNSTDNTTREIARQILLSYHDFKNLKASELARNSFCNASTINRFCKTIGFNSFSDLKSFMISSHDVRKAQIIHHMEVTSEEDILKNIRNLCTGKLDEYRLKEDIRVLNERIAAAPRVVLIGAVFPNAMTLHYQEDMLEMGKCVYSSPVARQLEVPAEDPDAVIILISFTGRLINYCLSDYNEICRKYKNTFLMTSNKDLFAADRNANYVQLPFDDDNESNNALFIEIMRYIKYRYYADYGKELL